MARRIGSMLCLAVGCLAAPPAAPFAAGLETEPQGGRRGSVAFQRIDVTGLPEVAVYFTVADDSGRAVLGLAPGDLTIRVDGIEERAAVLRSALADGEHLAIAVLFDRSGSMRSGLAPAQEAALDFLSRLSEADRAAVIAFDDEVTLQAPLNADRARLAAAIRGIEPGRNTALYDAIAAALDALAEASTPRLAIVLLSDGRDTRSTVSREAVLRRAREQGVPIFVLGLPVDADTDSLRELARETGGSYLQAAEPRDLRHLYQRIADQLQNQYLLRFTSTAGADEGWHRLVVAVAGAAEAISEEREFLASTGPGISGARLGEFRRGLLTQDLVRASGLGTLAGFLLGAMLLAGAELAGRGAAVRSLVGGGVLLAAGGLGAILGCLLTLVRS